ncbi:hypothetical protein SLA2020_041020 [Shorea laevis]
MSRLKSVAKRLVNFTQVGLTLTRISLKILQFYNCYMSLNPELTVTHLSCAGLGNPPNFFKLQCYAALLNSQSPFLFSHLVTEKEMAE